MNELDKKVKKLLKGNFDESTPSPDFTTNVMNKIAEQETKPFYGEMEYKPVISKTGWIIIAVSFFLIAFIAFIGEKEPRFTLSNFMPEWHFKLDIAYSQIVLISVLGVLMLLIIDSLFMRHRQY